MGVVRLGLIGAGGVARLHAEAARVLSDEVRLTAVTDLDGQRAAELARSVGATAYPDHQSLLGEVDAVVVCTPHALHLEPALDAAAAGVHVLMEKPMATSLADCDAMASACLSAGVELFLGHIQHYLPITRAAHRAVGLIGEPVALVDRRSTDYRAGHRPAWFFDPAVAGGGAIMNIGAHCVDRVTWLAGARPVSVSAQLVRRGGRVETEGVLHLTLDNGALATVSIVDNALAAVDELEVLGAHGTLRASRQSGVRVVTAGGVRMVQEPSDKDVFGAFRDQLADFAAAVRGDRPVAIGARAGRDVVATVLAAYASATSGHPECVELD
ncbi:Gfo/Idh/MocA family protein [Nonomuraea sp. NPDC050556]|uniref:Gfo/Idh/MocA family protein n=1 Tax=Nonomuraea sp. NPDC050556 TaxID=3364369 RepID=UPI0037B25D0D